MEELYEALKTMGIIKQGHYKLTTGKHSNIYFQKDELWHRDVNLRNLIIDKLYSLSRIDNYINCEIVTGPATAGSMWALSIALELQTPFVYCEKKDDKMVYGRGFDKIIENKKILIVEDIITTGKSVKKTIQAIIENKGTISGIVCIWNRKRTIFDYPVFSLINKIVYEFDSDDCPQCNNKEPLHDPKTGKVIEGE